MISSFAEIPDILMSVAELSNNHQHRFIVCKVSDESSKDSNSKVIICVRSLEDFSSHDSILKWLRYEILDDFKVICLGGGTISLCQETKLAKITGRSFNFGIEPNRSETVRLFESFLPDFVISQ